ncbi:hypothetical protein AURDEDRAFT_170852 [Auricularia subglabra TFB-10046 SS5]|nr:hypothetical protein AURDEDRAFT_170852 [Auricularia subglabra TFB-10046 SS5]
MPRLAAPGSQAPPRPAESSKSASPDVALTQLPPIIESTDHPVGPPDTADTGDVDLSVNEALELSDVATTAIVSGAEPDDDVRPGPYNLRRRPRIIRDVLPEQLEPVEPEAVEREPSPASVSPAGLTGPAPRKIGTRPNKFGLWKEYQYPPSVDPEDLADSADCLAPKLRPSPSNSLQPTNRISNVVTSKSHQLLLQWHTSGSGKKSLQDTTHLVEDVLRDPEFDLADFRDNSWKRTFSTVGESVEGDNDGWTAESVTIDVPIMRRFRHLHDGAHSMGYILHGFQHRRLCPLIRYILECEESSAAWTFDPYRLFVTREDGQVERVYGEVYCSDAMIEEHAKIQEKVIPEDQGGALPRCVIALMFGSDATHLAQFGTSSIWPGYMMFGNESKYRRARPSANAVHQICYFERLPDAAQTFIKTHTGGKAAKNALLTFCKREAMHESWRILLDDEFIHAYEWGMVVNCIDGVCRLCFPRIITYTADYPEKVIIATIKDKGDCLCPRCHVTKAQVPKVGQKLDMLRRTTQAREDNATRKWKVAAA